MFYPRFNTTSDNFSTLTLRFFGGDAEIPNFPIFYEKSLTVRGKVLRIRTRFNNKELIMNKSELVAEIAKNANASKVAVECILDEAIIAITEAMKKGEEVRLMGFGTFDVSSRAAREGRNLRTGEKMMIPASKAPRFKASKLLKDAVK